MDLLIILNFTILSARWLDILWVVKHTFHIQGFCLRMIDSYLKNSAQMYDTLNLTHSRVSDRVVMSGDHSGTDFGTLFLECVIWQILHWYLHKMGNVKGEPWLLPILQNIPHLYLQQVARLTAFSSASRSRFDLNSFVDCMLCGELWNEVAFFIEAILKAKKFFFSPN